MSRRLVSTVTPLVALVIGLSACSGTPAESETNTPTTVESQLVESPAAEPSMEESIPTDGTATTASKVLTGEVAGITLEVGPKPPSLDEAMAMAEVEMEPASCAQYGTPAMDEMSMGGSPAMMVTVQVGSDATFLPAYMDYVNRCTSFSGTVNGIATSGTMAEETPPTIDGASDMVAVLTSTTSGEGETASTINSYVLGGVVDGTTITVSVSTGDGSDPDPAVAQEVFEAQTAALSS